MTEKLAKAASAIDLSLILEPLMHDGALSGATCAVWQGGEVISIEAAGVSNLDESTPMRPDSIFQIASMTKPILAAATMQMIEEGLLSLDAPIANWIPEFASPGVLNDPQGALENCTPARRPITVEDLLTHRSGISYAFTSTGPIANAYHVALGSPTDTRHSPDSWIAALSTLPLLNQPGEQMEYGHSFELLGFLLTRIEGRTLDSLLQHRIFEPLGMKDTAFHVRPADRHRLAHIYTRTEDSLVDSTDAPLSPPLFQAGGGGLYSSAPDYLRFALMLHHLGTLDGTQILSPESVMAMRQDRLTIEQHQQPFLGTNRWASHGAGLGLMTILNPDTAPPLGIGAAGAYGWFGAFGTWWQTDPVHDLIAIYMIQDGISLLPGSVSQRSLQPPPPARAGLPRFQNRVYDLTGARKSIPDTSPHSHRAGHTWCEQPKSDNEIS